MGTDEVRSIKVFGGWEFLEGMVNSYPQTNYFRYIAFSNEEKLIIERYFFSKKNTPEFYNKDVDIRLFKDDDDMIFDRCAGNPPFGSQKIGDRDLYVKVLDKVIPNSKESKIICPTTFITYYTKKDKYTSIKRMIKDVKLISGNSFDATFSYDLAIITFDNSLDSDIYKDFFFIGYRNPELVSLIYNELEQMPKIGDKLIRFKSKNPFVDKDKYYVGFTKTGGNIRKGIKQWDFYTFYTKDYPIEKGYISESWECGIPFDSKEDAEDYKNYLNTDIALFSLYVYKKNKDLGSGSVPYVPYKVDINDLAQRISSISDYSVQDVINYITEEMKPYGLKSRPSKSNKSKKEK